MWIGDGIFSTPHGPHAIDHGRLWMASRKTAAHIFTRQNFRELMSSTFREKGEMFIKILNQVSPGQPIDMQQKFFAFTMDSIMTIFFGRTTNTLKGTFDRFAGAFDEAQRRLFHTYFE
jgi:cytochrome P450